MLRTSLLAVALAAALAGAGVAQAQDFDDQGDSFQDHGQDLGQDRGDVRPRGRDLDRDDDRRGEWRRGLLPPRAIIGSLYRRGYRDVEIRRQRGSSYIVRAANRRGSRVILVVDGRTTEITGLRVIDRYEPSFDDGGWNAPRPWSGPRW
jgi:Ni/Co efflux regulator RcnB